MPLPDLIEIVPLAQPVKAEITVPGSKSITNRALILAALADGETVLRGALWSEDTQIMVECLQDLGFMVNVEDDPNESCNRTITVYGRGGTIPPGGTAESPMELFVGNAGTAARFLAALVCLGSGTYRLHGVPRMHERPQAALFAALRELGYRVDSTNDKLPATIFGGTRNAERGVRKCRVSVAESSQFASALLLAAGQGGWEIEVTGANEDELPYVEMTRQLVKAFPKIGGEFQIEPDASSGSYFWAVDWLMWIAGFNDEMGKIVVRNWPTSGWQIDAEYPRYRTLSVELSRQLHLGDSIMTHIAVAPCNPDSRPDQRPPKGQFFFPGSPSGGTGSPPPMVFKDLGRLRVQECDRVKALHDELKKCGARICWPEGRDELQVYPSAGSLHGAEIETYNDHRMAMCFAVLGLKVPGIKLCNPSCVKKTFPNFFQKLAAPPPHGLGATILDARTGQKLSHDDLFAA
jgi:3-phosphoshikimate 1-carboxyvinyltransferase